MPEKQLPKDKYVCRSTFWRFVRTVVAGAAAFGISFIPVLSTLPAEYKTAEIVLVTSFLVSADKYRREKGYKLRKN